jgi:hypothetical protein
MMKRVLFVSLLVAAAAAAASAQVFPGVSPATAKELAAAKRSVPFALPAWVPAGFKVTQVHAVLGPKVKIEDRQLIIVYTRERPNGRIQRFAIEAGFDGLGDLMYDRMRTVRTPVGPVYLVYQPNDEDGKKLTDFSMTEWFTIGKTAFHYDGMYATVDEGGEKLEMISLADTEKILKSLKRY